MVWVKLMSGKNKIRSNLAVFSHLKSRRMRERGRGLYTPTWTITYHDFLLPKNIEYHLLQYVLTDLLQTHFTSLVQWYFPFNAGKYVFAHCDESPTKCRDCGHDEYQPDWNSDTKCIPQKFCDEGQCHIMRVKKEYGLILHYFLTPAINLPLQVKDLTAHFHTTPPRRNCVSASRGSTALWSTASTVRPLKNVLREKESWWVVRACGHSTQSSLGTCLWANEKDSYSGKS